MPDRPIWKRTETKDFRWLSCGVPPVLIPNTEVKPTYTDSTVLETAWEDRQLPDPKEKSDSHEPLFCLFSDTALLMIIGIIRIFFIHVKDCYL